MQKNLPSTLIAHPIFTFNNKLINIKNSILGTLYYTKCILINLDFNNVFFFFFLIKITFLIISYFLWRCIFNIYIYKSKLKRVVSMLLNSKYYTVYES